MTPTYSADLAQFVSDYLETTKNSGVGEVSDEDVAEAYIESCSEGEATPAELDAEVVKFIPQIKYLRAP